MHNSKQYHPKHRFDTQDKTLKTELSKFGINMEIGLVV